MTVSISQIKLKLRELKGFAQRHTQEVLDEDSNPHLPGLNAHTFLLRQSGPFNRLLCPFHSTQT